MDAEWLDKLLAAAVKNAASDIHLKAGSPPAFRIHGDMRELKLPRLMPEDTWALCEFITAKNPARPDLSRTFQIDTSYSVTNVARFRVNMFRTRGTFALVLRAIPFEVPDLASLKLPPSLAKIAELERGLVLVTGVTGSGKSTTLAAIVDAINANHPKHIITIEDPIEFLHKDKRSRVTQREIGADTQDFTTALRAALREDPDVILVGEMRDTETIEIALKSAETGHLVLSTVHTPGAVGTIDRLVNAFPLEAQLFTRIRIADALQATTSQRLLPNADGHGRIAACEIMFRSKMIEELIKNPDRTDEITDYLDREHDSLGTQSFDAHLRELYQGGLITLDVARGAANSPANFDRAMMFQ